MTYKYIWIGAGISVAGMASQYLVPESLSTMFAGLLIFLIGVATTAIGAFTARPSDEELVSDKLAVLKAIAAAYPANNDQT